MRRAMVCLGLLLSACGGQSAPAPKPVAPAAAPDRWPGFAAAFIESYFKANPFFAVQAGRHEFDGQMADWSAAGIAAEIARMQKERSRTAAFDAAALTGAERFEREYLL